jgi:hypothetical protein
MIILLELSRALIILFSWDDVDMIFTEMSLSIYIKAGLWTIIIALIASTICQ